MSALEQAARMALEVIEGADEIDTDMRDAADALRAALDAGQAQPAGDGFTTIASDGQRIVAIGVDVYASPPARQRLTEEHISRLIELADGSEWSDAEFARAIERAHGIT